MGQRDTIIPVCKVVTILNNSVSSIQLSNTAQEAIVSVTSPVGSAPNSKLPFFVSSNVIQKPGKGGAGSGCILAASAAKGELIFENSELKHIKMSRNGTYDLLTAPSDATLSVSSAPNQVSSMGSAASFTGLRTGDEIRVSATQAIYASSFARGIFTSAVASVEVYVNNQLSMTASSQEANATTNVVVTDSGWYPTASVAAVGVRNGVNLRSSSCGGFSPAVVTASSDSLGGTFTVKRSNKNAKVPYVSVTDLSGIGGYFRVAPGAPVSDMYVSSVASLRSNINIIKGTEFGSDSASAFPGVIGGPGDTVTLTLPGAQAIETVIIENSFKNSAAAEKHGLFAINYGVIKQAPTLSDDQLDNPR